MSKKIKDPFLRANLKRPVRGELYKLKFKMPQGYTLSSQHDNMVIRLKRRLKNTRYYYKALVIMAPNKTIAPGIVIKLNINPNSLEMSQL